MASVKVCAEKVLVSVVKMWYKVFYYDIVEVGSNFNY